MIRRFLLVSSSPRRREILRMVGVPFRVLPVNSEEVVLESPYDTAVENAIRKVELAMEFQVEDELALSADTIVILDGKVLGKPKDEGEAKVMLEELSGREHRVITGFALRFPNGKVLKGFEESSVRFKSLSREEISWYVNTKEPLDKAGSYGIQGIGALFVERIEGDFFNVMGLPIGKIYDILLLHNFDIKSLVV